MRKTGLSFSLVAWLALMLAGCITTPDTEAGIGQRQKWEAACQAKGLRRNTPEFQGCVSSAAAGRPAGTWVGVGW